MKKEIVNSGCIYPFKIRFIPLDSFQCCPVRIISMSRVLMVINVYPIIASVQLHVFLVIVAKTSTMQSISISSRKTLKEITKDLYKSAELTSLYQ
jgi:hypothetical protein